MSRFVRPVPLTEAHDCTGFRCGRPALDAWLTGRAWRNQGSGASRTFVSTPPADRRVAGFYSLSACSVRPAEAPGAIRRNMPDPIPVILLGRLAVDQSAQGAGLGRALLQDAVRRVLTVAGTVGVRALLVNALDDQATGFYRRFGFVPSPLGETTLFLPIGHIRDSLATTATTA